MRHADYARYAADVDAMPYTRVADFAAAASHVAGADAYAMLCELIC